MTENEWQHSANVSAMLGALAARKSPWAWSTRKSRLFGCGCCRRVWPVLTEPGQRAAVEAAERAADKLMRVADLASYHGAAVPIRLGVEPSWHSGLRGSHSLGGWGFWVDMTPQRDMLCNPGGKAALPTPWGKPYSVANDARALLHFRAGAKAVRGEQRAQCDLLRDVVGPVRPLPVIDRAWRVANDRVVLRMAEGIYEERAFGRLPILADALEEAGCAEADLLGHCRRPGEHVRGCWVVDLLLGKK